MNSAVSGSEPMIGNDLSYAELLARAREQAESRHLDDVFIVDADFHHSEGAVWGEILEYVDNEVLRQFLRYGGRSGLWIPGMAEAGEIQEVGGRIQINRAHADSHPELSGAMRDVIVAREAMDAMGSNYTCFFPAYLLDLGTIQYDLEAPLAHAWSRWVTDRVLPQEPRLLTLLPLPLTDPHASLRLVEDFGDSPSVVGYMVTSVRYDPLYTKQYAKVWRAIEEQGRTVGFHGSFTGQGPIGQLNRFISIHSITFPLFQMIQATNWIVNGMPERYPDLDVLFIEGGLAWVPFLMQRLDHEYAMRVSEAPLLQKRPSEYMRDFFYTTQPLELSNLSLLEMTMDMINAETQLLYASDWPHWDWDPPRKVWDLPFLSEPTKRRIMGENARGLFKLPADPQPVAARSPAEMSDVANRA